MANQATPLARSHPVVLRDGTTVRLRRVQPRDVAEILLFLKGLSPRSLYLRLCSGGANLVAVAHEFAEAGSHRYGIVAVGARGEIVAQAEYVPVGSDTAEVAVVVGDLLQGRGLATRMIEHLAEAARGNGIERFVAEVLPSNQAMLTVFTRAFGASVIESDSACEVEFGITAPVADRVAA